jgi:hypothetical protein
MDSLRRLIGCIFSSLGALRWWEWLILVGLGVLSGLITLLGSIALGIIVAATAGHFFGLLSAESMPHFP